MTILDRKHSILNYLVDNLKTDPTRTVDASHIAEKLRMSVKDTCQIIKMMNAMGIVESDQEGERVLVTRQGLAYAAETSLSKAA
jgi:predicted transcriptional regulator